jgi:ectoine hydroxylase-related dioxygenase (phytanoyl-CoA dioxygenase family)
MPTMTALDFEPITLPPEHIEHHAREIEDRGYTIIPNVLSPERTALVRDTLESIFEDEKEVAVIRNWHNNMYKVAYMLAQKHPVFRELPMNPALLPIMKRVLGPYLNLASTNGLTMTPGGIIQELHMDQAESCVGHVLTINALHCLDEFTKANGGTRLVPYSHKKQWQARMLDLDDPIEQEAVYLEAPAGSVIAYAGALLHAGSQNKTDKMRRAIHLFYTKPWYKPQWDFPHSLSADVVATLSPEQLSLFGYHSQPNGFDFKENKLTYQGPKQFARSKGRGREKAKD